MKRILFVALVCLATLTSKAAVVSGTCGENLTWSINSKDSTLTITGSGEMSYWDWSDFAPWYEYRSYIAYVSLPNGLMNIGYAFMDCNRLTYIEISNSVTYIGERAFAKCINLKYVIIPNSVNRIDYVAFEYCENLEAAYISSLESWCKINFNDFGSNPLHHAHNLYLNGQLITNLVIPDNIDSISNYAFWGCHSIKTLKISNNVVNVGYETFSECKNLTSVEIPNSVINIDERAFAYCENLSFITIGNGITNLASEAFIDCPVSKLYMLSTTPPSGGVTCGINNLTCDLYVPAEAINTYSNTIWWEDFQHIFPIGSSLDRYRVEFLDWDGTILKVDSVEHGYPASEPDAPTRAGYTFTYWDKDFDNITSDLVVTAQYELGENTEFTIVFSNGNDGSWILNHNATLKVPEAPQIDGFTFIGWRPVAAIIGYNTIEIEAVYEADEPASAPEVMANPANPTQKLIRNGNVYILTDTKTYTIQGQEVR